MSEIVLKSLKLFMNFVSRIIVGTTHIGSFFLLATMLVIVANIIYRLFGRVIYGSYELVELSIAITAASAVAYATSKNLHIVIDIIIARVTKAAKIPLKIFDLLFSITSWIFIAWASIELAFERLKDKEQSALLSIPLWPFRFFWEFIIILICLLFIIELVKALFKGD